MKVDGHSWPLRVELAIVDIGDSSSTEEPNGERRDKSVMTSCIVRYSGESS
jgi:hypothetical protein